MNKRKQQERVVRLHRDQVSLKPGFLLLRGQTIPLSQLDEKNFLKPLPALRYDSG